MGGGGAQRAGGDSVFKLTVLLCVVSLFYRARAPPGANLVRG